MSHKQAISEINDRLARFAMHQLCKPWFSDDDGTHGFLRLPLVRFDLHLKLVHQFLQSRHVLLVLLRLNLTINKSLSRSKLR